MINYVNTVRNNNNIIIIIIIIIEASIMDARYGITTLVLEQKVEHIINTNFS